MERRNFIKYTGIGAMIAAPTTSIAGSVCTMPAPNINRSVNIMDAPFSASPTNCDNTTNIQKAIDYAKQNGVSVYVPPLTFIYSGELSLNGVGIFGDGYRSVLQCTQFGNGAIRLIGEGSFVFNLRRTYSGPTSRSQGDKACAINTNGASKFTISQVWIEGASAAGILIRQSSYFSINNCHIENTMADGIHITGASSYGTLNSNICNNTGDDSFAVVSYVSDGELCKHITISSCVSEMSGARGIACVGAYGVSISNSVVHSPVAAGLFIDSSSAYDTYATENVTVSNCLFIECGRVSSGYQAAMFIAGRAGYITSNINISGCQVIKARWRGIQVGTTPNVENVKHCIISNCIVESCGKDGIHSQGAKYLDITNVTVENISSYGMYIDKCLGAVKISDNKFININYSNDSAVDMLHFSNGGSYSKISICNNIFENENNYTIDKAISCMYDDVIFSSNYWDSTTSVKIGLNNSRHAKHFRNRRQTEMSTQPSAGTWNKGDFVWNATGTSLGWLCSQSGTFGLNNPIFTEKL